MRHDRSADRGTIIRSACRYLDAVISGPVSVPHGTYDIAPATVTKPQESGILSEFKNLYQIDAIDVRPDEPTPTDGVAAYTVYPDGVDAAIIILKRNGMVSLCSNTLDTTFDLFKLYGDSSIVWDSDPYPRCVDTGGAQQLHSVIEDGTIPDKAFVCLEPVPGAPNPRWSFTFVLPDRSLVSVSPIHGFTKNNNDHVCLLHAFTLMDADKVVFTGYSTREGAAKHATGTMPFLVTTHNAFVFDTSKHTLSIVGPMSTLPISTVEIPDCTNILAGALVHQPDTSTKLLKIVCTSAESKQLKTKVVGIQTSDASNEHHWTASIFSLDTPHAWASAYRYIERYGALLHFIRATELKEAAAPIIFNTDDHTDSSCTDDVFAFVGFRTLGDTIPDHGIAFSCLRAIILRVNMLPVDAHTLASKLHILRRYVMALAPILKDSNCGKLITRLTGVNVPENQGFSAFAFYVDALSTTLLATRFKVPIVPQHMNLLLHVESTRVNAERELRVQLNAPRGPAPPTVVSTYKETWLKHHVYVSDLWSHGRVSLYLANSSDVAHVKYKEREAAFRGFKSRSQAVKLLKADPTLHRFLGMSVFVPFPAIPIQVGAHSTKCFVSTWFASGRSDPLARAVDGSPIIEAKGDAAVTNSTYVMYEGPHLAVVIALLITKIANQPIVVDAPFYCITQATRAITCNAVAPADVADYDNAVITDDGRITTLDTGRTIGSTAPLRYVNRVPVLLLMQRPYNLLLASTLLAHGVYTGEEKKFSGDTAPSRIYHALWQRATDGYALFDSKHLPLEYLSFKLFAWISGSSEVQRITKVEQIREFLPPPEKTDLVEVKALQIHKPKRSLLASPIPRPASIVPTIGTEDHGDDEGDRPYETAKFTIPDPDGINQIAHFECPFNATQKNHVIGSLLYLALFRLPGDQKSDDVPHVFNSHGEPDVVHIAVRAPSVATITRLCSFVREEHGNSIELLAQTCRLRNFMESRFKAAAIEMSHADHLQTSRAVISNFQNCSDMFDQFKQCQQEEPTFMLYFVACLIHGIREPDNIKNKGQEALERVIGTLECGPLIKHLIGCGREADITRLPILYRYILASAPCMLDLHEDEVVGWYLNISDRKDADVFIQDFQEMVETTRPRRLLYALLTDNLLLATEIALHLPDRQSEWTALVLDLFYKRYDEPFMAALHAISYRQERMDTQNAYSRLEHERQRVHVQFHGLLRALAYTGPRELLPPVVPEEEPDSRVAINEDIIRWIMQLIYPMSYVKEPRIAYNQICETFHDLDLATSTDRYYETTSWSLSACHVVDDKNYLRLYLTIKRMVANIRQHVHGLLPWTSTEGRTSFRLPLGKKLLCPFARRVNGGLMLHRVFQVLATNYDYMCVVRDDNFKVAADPRTVYIFVNVMRGVPQLYARARRIVYMLMTWCLAFRPLRPLTTVEALLRYLILSYDSNPKRKRKPDHTPGLDHSFWLECIQEARVSGTVFDVEAVTLCNANPDFFKPDYSQRFVVILPSNICEQLIDANHWNLFRSCCLPSCDKAIEELRPVWLGTPPNLGPVVLHRIYDDGLYRFFDRAVEKKCSTFFSVCPYNGETIPVVPLADIRWVPCSLEALTKTTERLTNALFEEAWQDFTIYASRRLHVVITKTVRLGVKERVMTPLGFNTDAGRKIFHVIRQTDHAQLPFATRDTPGFEPFLRFDETHRLYTAYGQEIETSQDPDKLTIPFKDPGHSDFVNPLPFWSVPIPRAILERVNEDLVYMSLCCSCNRHVLGADTQFKLFQIVDHALHDRIDANHHNANIHLLFFILLSAWYRRGAVPVPLMGTFLATAHHMRTAVSLSQAYQLYKALPPMTICMGADAPLLDDPAGHFNVNAAADGLFGDNTFCYNRTHDSNAPLCTLQLMLADTFSHIDVRELQHLLPLTSSLGVSIQLRERRCFSWCAYTPNIVVSAGRDWSRQVGVKDVTSKRALALMNSLSPVIRVPHKRFMPMVEQNDAASEVRDVLYGPRVHTVWVQREDTIRSISVQVVDRPLTRSNPHAILAIIPAFDSMNIQDLALELRMGTLAYRSLWNYVHTQRTHDDVEYVEFEQHGVEVVPYNIDNWKLEVPVSAWTYSGGGFPSFLKTYDTCLAPAPRLSDVSVVFTDEPETHLNARRVFVKHVQDLLYQFLPSSTFRLSLGVEAIDNAGLRIPPHVTGPDQTVSMYSFDWIEDAPIDPDGHEQKSTSIPRKGILQLTQDGHQYVYAVAEYLLDNEMKDRISLGGVSLLTPPRLSNLRSSLPIPKPRNGYHIWLGSTSSGQVLLPQVQKMVLEAYARLQDYNPDTPNVICHTNFSLDVDYQGSIFIIADEGEAAQLVVDSHHKHVVSCLIHTYYLNVIDSAGSWHDRFQYVIDEKTKVDCYPMSTACILQQKHPVSMQLLDNLLTQMLFITDPTFIDINVVAAASTDPSVITSLIENLNVWSMYPNGYKDKAPSKAVLYSRALHPRRAKFMLVLVDATDPKTYTEVTDICYNDAGTYRDDTSVIWVTTYAEPKAPLHSHLGPVKHEWDAWVIPIRSLEQGYFSQHEQGAEIIDNYIFAHFVMRVEDILNYRATRVDRAQLKYGKATITVDSPVCLPVAFVLKSALMSKHRREDTVEQMDIIITRYRSSFAYMDAQRNHCLVYTMRDMLLSPETHVLSLCDLRVVESPIMHHLLPGLPDFTHDVKCWCLISDVHGFIDTVRYDDLLNFVTLMCHNWKRSAMNCTCVYFPEGWDAHRWSSILLHTLASIGSDKLVCYSRAAKPDVLCLEGLHDCVYDLKALFNAEIEHVNRHPREGRNKSIGAALAQYPPMGFISHLHRNHYVQRPLSTYVFKWRMQFIHEVKFNVPRYVEIRRTTHDMMGMYYANHYEVQSSKDAIDLIIYHVADLTVELKIKQGTARRHVILVQHEVEDDDDSGDDGNDSDKHVLNMHRRNNLEVVRYARDEDLADAIDRVLDPECHHMADSFRISSWDAGGTIKFALPVRCYEYKAQLRALVDNVSALDGCCMVMFVPFTRHVYSNLAKLVHRVRNQDRTITVDRMIVVGLVQSGYRGWRPCKTLPCIPSTHIYTIQILDNVMYTQGQFHSPLLDVQPDVVNAIASDARFSWPTTSLRVYANYAARWSIPISDFMQAMTVASRDVYFQHQEDARYEIEFRDIDRQDVDGRYLASIPVHPLTRQSMASVQWQKRKAKIDQYRTMNRLSELTEDIHVIMYGKLSHNACHMWGRELSTAMIEVWTRNMYGNKIMFAIQERVDT